jgi:hypothetical protein
MNKDSESTAITFAWFSETHVKKAEIESQTSIGVQMRLPLGTAWTLAESTTAVRASKGCLHNMQYGQKLYRTQV